MRLSRSLAMALAALAVACSPHAGAGSGPTAKATAGQSVHRLSGLRVIPLVVNSAGKTHQFSVEVARTEAEQQRGLMFRTEMGADEGMIFPMSPPRFAAFWMKNTVISLDIIFIGRDRRILNIAANAVPYSEAPIPSDGPAVGVLELNGGRAATLGIKPGDAVAW